MTGVADTIPRLKFPDAPADRIDDARAIKTRRKWQTCRVLTTGLVHIRKIRSRRTELTTSEIKINKVDPGRTQLDAHFAWSRVRQFQVAEPQSLRSTVLFNADCFHQKVPQRDGELRDQSQPENDVFSANWGSRQHRFKPLATARYDRTVPPAKLGRHTPPDHDPMLKGWWFGFLERLAAVQAILADLRNCPGVTPTRRLK